MIEVFASQAFSQAFTEADFFGKLIFFALFSLSIISWYYLIYKVWMLRQVKRNAKQFKLFIEKNRRKLLSSDALPPSERNCLPHPFHALYFTLKEKTIEILDKNRFFSAKTPSHQHYLSRTDIELIDSHLQTTIIKMRRLIEKNLFILSTTTTLAPFLGLLGTVWGILITFGELQAGHTITSNVVILGGLSTALTTTVLGLLIAIPALIGYNYLKNTSRHFTSEMYDFSHFLLSTVELQYRKVDVDA
jgi:biopolymer transport protein TolQ